MSKIKKQGGSGVRTKLKRVSEKRNSFEFFGNVDVRTLHSIKFYQILGVRAELLGVWGNRAGFTHSTGVV